MSLRLLLRALGVTVVVPCFALAAAPVEAAGGVVLVGCDLFSLDGPKVEFVQSQGVSSTNGSSKRRRFFSSSGFRSDAFEGRDCAEVLSAVIDDGLEFQAMSVFGQDADLALWFFREV